MLNDKLLLRQARTQLMRTEFVLRAELQRIVETITELDEALEESLNSTTPVVEPMQEGR